MGDEKGPQPIYVTTDVFQIQVRVITDALARIENAVSKLADQTLSSNSDTQKKFDSTARDNEDRYVSKEEFKPVRLIAYGMTGAILLAFIGAITALVYGGKVG